MQVKVLIIFYYSFSINYIDIVIIHNVLKIKLMAELGQIDGQITIEQATSKYNLYIFKKLY